MGRTTPLALGLCALFLLSHQSCAVQGVPRAGGPQNGVVLIKLVQPIYPPVARVAHIMGDVDLLISVRQDGAVDTVVATSGHPLLKESAVTSVRQSKFECRGCTEQFNKYRLVYTFQIEGECPCEPIRTQSKQKEQEQTYPRVTDAQERVTVVADILCICDPAFTLTRKVRSVKCLYLWKCGLKSSPRLP